MSTGRASVFPIASVPSRHRRIARLRAAIRSGAYRVPSEAVAESLLNRLDGLLPIRYAPEGGTLQQR